jgi:hypothetical protein
MVPVVDEAWTLLPLLLKVSTLVLNSLGFEDLDEFIIETLQISFLKAVIKDNEIRQQSLQKATHYLE